MNKSKTGSRCLAVSGRSSKQLYSCFNIRLVRKSTITYMLHATLGRKLFIPSAVQVASMSLWPPHPDLCILNFCLSVWCVYKDRSTCSIGNKVTLGEKIRLVFEAMNKILHLRPPCAARKGGNTARERGNHAKACRYMPCWPREGSFRFSAQRCLFALQFSRACSSNCRAN